MPIFSRHLTRRSSLRRLAFAGLAVAALAACKDLTSIDASLPNITEVLEVYAINGSAPGAPTAVSLLSGGVFRADQGFAFDLAFDIDAGGNVRLIPARVLASLATSAGHPVGLQLVPGPFADLTDAPKDGYRVDTTLVVAKGAVVAVESHDFQTCAYALKGSTYFSKLFITDIDVALRKITMSVTVNRNCGFRSFEPGIPRS